MSCDNSTEFSSHIICDICLHLWYRIEVQRQKTCILLSIFLTILTTECKFIMHMYLQS